MENNIIYQDNLSKNTKVNKINSNFSKIQFSIINRSFLICGLGFLAIMLIGYATYAGYDAYSYYYELQLWLPWITTACLLISFVSYLVWSFKLRKEMKINGWAIATICLYCLGNGFGFGSLFYLLKIHQLILIFGIAFFIFLSAWIVSKFLTNKIGFSIAKIAMVVSGIWFCLFLIIMFLSIFWVPTFSNFGYIYLIITGVSGLVFILFLVYQMWLMRKSQDFLLVNNDQANVMAFIFGFNMLTNFIGIIWITTRFVSRYAVGGIK